MLYKAIRKQMESGDVLMVKGKGPISRLIRAFSGESISHIAYLIRRPEGLFVAEMKEGKGFRFIPASQWGKENAGREILWGKFPGIARGQLCHEDYVMSQREKPYSYWTLVTVWLAQWGLWKLPGNAVCSTFAQRGWLHCGFDKIPGLADPGEFLNYARDINRVGF